MENYHIILVEAQKPNPFFHQLLIIILFENRICEWEAADGGGRTRRSVQSCCVYVQWGGHVGGFF